MDRTSGPSAPSSYGNQTPKLGVGDFQKLLDGFSTIGQGIGAIGDGISAEGNRLEGMPPKPRPRPDRTQQRATPMLAAGGDSLVDRTLKPSTLTSTPKKLPPLTGEGNRTGYNMPGVIDVGDQQIAGPATVAAPQTTTKVIEVQVRNPNYVKNIGSALSDKKSDKGGNALGATVTSSEPEFITERRTITVPVASPQVVVDDRRRPDPELIGGAALRYGSNTGSALARREPDNAERKAEIARRWAGYGKNSDGTAMTLSGAEGGVSEGAKDEFGNWKPGYGPSNDHSAYYAALKKKLEPKTAFSVDGGPVPIRMLRRA